MFLLQTVQFSHHSLIRWGFLLQGAIDQYSQLITFLQCSANNKAETTVSLFEQAFEIYGVPSRKMIELKGEGPGKYIAASSVHNQRIERLWRDVWNYICSQFYYIFQAMEAQSQLNYSKSDLKWFSMLSYC